jgi:RHS repeat-associated protein
VVAVARQGDKSRAQVARSFGISESCLARWLQIADRDGATTSGPAPPCQGDLEAENRELRKRAKQLRTLGTGGSQTTYTLDGANRRLNQTTQTDTGTSTLLRHYADSSDTPTWSVHTTAGITTTTRYNELINGHLGLTLTTTAGTTKARLDVVTPRGDTATSITLSNSMTGPEQTAATSIDNWTSYNEHGQPNQTPNTTPGGTTGIGYGWLGAKQRTTLDTGLVLMGARLYNSASGLFTSSDPIYGGNSTEYGYPNDPVNNSDVTGLSGSGVTNGLKGVHQAAWCVYYGTLACASMRIAALRAESFARSLKGAQWDARGARRRNAVQHAYWMAEAVRLLSNRWSSSDAYIMALQFGRAHELDDPSTRKGEGARESQKDLTNNMMGARLGKNSLRWNWDTAKVKSRIAFLASNKCRGEECLQIDW